MLTSNQDRLMNEGTNEPMNKLTNERMSEQTSEPINEQIIKEWQEVCSMLVEH
jgi:hypothetical protein